MPDAFLIRKYGGPDVLERGSLPTQDLGLQGRVSGQEQSSGSQGGIDGVRNKGYAQTVRWLLEDADSPWLRNP